MDRAPDKIVERLGTAGLARALADLLDPPQLVRLANACGLKYPGMRTQSQAPQRLLKDLVNRANKQAGTRQAILRALSKETAVAARAWAELTAEEKTQRLCDDAFLSADGNLGLHLFLLASETERTDLAGFADRLAHHHLLCMASNGAGSDPSAREAREQTRLKRQVSARDKKIRHMESQLAKSRETQKVAKRDLIQRKGELAESRMLVERLRRELASAQTAAQVASAGKSEAASDKAIGELTKAIRSLSSEQRKLIHQVEKKPKSRASAPLSSKALEPLASALNGLKADIGALNKDRTADAAAHAKAIEELRTALERRTKATVKKARRTRPRGSARRVGVFIDVQNVYYGAKRLKGKLDFDSLLEAAVQDRRLIRALAYVVESKETDQSQFIAMLEKRSIEVRRKALKIRADGSMKGDWDMELAMDILDAASRLDVVVLVSGDGDFTSLVKRVKSIGPRVEVIGFPRNTAKSLIETADAFQPLDRKFMIYSKSPKAAPNAEAKRGGPAATTAPPSQDQAPSNASTKEREKPRAAAR